MVRGKLRKRKRKVPEEEGEGHLCGGRRLAPQKKGTSCSKEQEGIYEKGKNYSKKEECNLFPSGENDRNRESVLGKGI